MHSAFARRWPSTDTSIIRITSIAWMASKIISWKLWSANRVFPVLPPFDLSVELPNSFHLSAFVASFAALAFLLAFSKNKIAIIVVVVSELFACSLDLMRWQPWEFQYLLTFLFFAVTKRANGRFADLIVLLFAATYIFSGLHKFSGGFLNGVWQRLVLDQVLQLPLSIRQQPLVYYCGLLLAAAETLIGLGILFAKDKRMFAVAGIIMHTVLLIVLGPIVLNQNPVVWPWNMGMALTLVLLFLRKEPSPYFNNWRKSPIVISFSLFFIIMPSLGLLGYCDRYLSFGIYSGGTPQLVICSDERSVSDEIAALTKPHSPISHCAGKVALRPEKIAFRELEVPIYPEVRALRILKAQWQQKFGGDNTFIIYEYPYDFVHTKEIK